MKTYQLLFIIGLTNVFIITGVYSQVKLDSGLVACYPFKGNANDYSGNNNNGVISGATLTADRFGNSNSAYSFNGTSDYIAVNNFGNLTTNNELSISVWAKATQLTSNCIFMLSPDSNQDRCVGCVEYTASPSAIIWDYGDIFNNGRTFKDGIPFQSKWDHYVFIVSQSKAIKQIYKNDTLISNTTYTSSLKNRKRTLLIGGGTDANPGNIRFHGVIDDMKIYNRALTKAEITQLYLSSANECLINPASIDSGLVACYPFSGNASDKSGHNHNGVVNGATLTSDRFGKTNSAYHFDGTSTIAINHFDSLISKNELSISLWAKADVLTSNCVFVLSPDNLSDRCVGCVEYVSSPTSVIWDYGNTSSGGRTYIDGIPFQSNWNHYVFIVSQSNNSKKIYKNDTLINNTAYSSSLINKNKTLLIGGSSTIYFNGSIDDIKIYNRAISFSEVDKIYKGNFTCDQTLIITASTTSICPNDSIQFTDHHTNKPKGWSWSFPGGNPSSSTLQNPKISYSAPGQYDVTLVATDSVNPADTVTYKKYVTILNPPAPVITVTGGATFCSGIGNLSSNYAAGNQWYYNGNAIGAATAKKYFPTQSGFYTVKETDTSGCTAISSLASVTVLPAPTAGITGKNSVCAGSSTDLTASGNGKYTWSTGDTTGLVSVAPVSNATYTLTVTGSNGCTATATQVINVNAVPATPTVLQNGSLLASSASTGNQWNLNGNPIPGATGQFYQPTKSGFYSVTVTGNDGCSATSSIISYTVTGITTIFSADTPLNIFPNPSQGLLNIDFGAAVNEKITVTILNELGELVYAETVSAGKKSVLIDLSGKAGNGVYTLVLQGDSGRKIQRVIFSE